MPIYSTDFFVCVKFELVCFFTVLAQNNRLGDLITLKTRLCEAL